VNPGNVFNAPQWGQRAPEKAVAAICVIRAFMTVTGFFGPDGPDNGTTFIADYIGFLLAFNV
jgi:hypothetical protein